MSARIEWTKQVPEACKAMVGLEQALAKPGLEIAQLELIRLRQAARSRGLYPLAGFSYQMPPRNGLMLGYGGIGTVDIDPALDRVRDILEQIG